MQHWFHLRLCSVFQLKFISSGRNIFSTVRNLVLTCLPIEKTVSDEIAIGWIVGGYVATRLFIPKFRQLGLTSIYTVSRQHFAN